MSAAFLVTWLMSVTDKSAQAKSEPRPRGTVHPRTDRAGSRLHIGTLIAVTEEANASPQRNRGHEPRFIHGEGRDIVLSGLSPSSKDFGIIVNVDCPEGGSIKPSRWFQGRGPVSKSTCTLRGLVIDAQIDQAAGLERRSQIQPLQDALTISSHSQGHRTWCHEN